MYIALLFAGVIGVAVTSLYGTYCLAMLVVRRRRAISRPE